MAKYSFIITISILAVISVVGANTCGDYKNCSSCTAEAGCMWALLYNCTERCMSTDYKDPKRLTARNVIWRSAVSNSTECPSKEECRIIEGNIKDPSFEEFPDGNWFYSSKDSFPMETGKYTKKGSKPSFDVALDGDMFLFMGRGHLAAEGKVYSARIEKLKIPKYVTHLSFFYAFPFFSGVFDYMMYFLNDRSSLNVFIDDKLILHLGSKTVNTSYYVHDTERYYHPMNIDVKQFADDGEHSLELFFIEAVKPGDIDTKGQGIVVDYIQFISSNSKKRVH